MKSKITVIIIGLLFTFLSLRAWFKSADEFSESERRVLAQMPAFNIENIVSGNFMSEFDYYATDQFPMRDRFRTIKALSSYNLFLNKDNNKIYTEGEHVSKIEYPLSYSMLEHATARFNHICEKYLSDKNKVYLSIIPDKHYFLSRDRLSMDYQKLVEHMREDMPYAEYIDIFNCLDEEDYYYTDSHWRQEKLEKVVEALGEGMDFEINWDFTQKKANDQFYGVYSGQSALPLKPEDLNYLTNEIIEGSVLKSYDTGKEKIVPIYDADAATSRDPYEMFMSGPDALQVLENPNAKTERELVIFRDSFASAITPLITEAYSKITLVDIRYINSDMLSSFVDFESSEVLFLYSSTMLNNSMGMK